MGRLPNIAGGSLGFDVTRPPRSSPIASRNSLLGTSLLFRTGPLLARRAASKADRRDLTEYSPASTLCAVFIADFGSISAHRAKIWSRENGTVFRAWASCGELAVSESKNSNTAIVRRIVFMSLSWARRLILRSRSPYLVFRRTSRAALAKVFQSFMTRPPGSREPRPDIPVCRPRGRKNEDFGKLCMEFRYSRRALRNSMHVAPKRNLSARKSPPFRRAFNRLALDPYAALADSPTDASRCMTCCRLRSLQVK